MSAPVRPDARQMLAADPQASAWVTANAGTGKTHVLVDRILRLLLAGTPPSAILCLTFTKAAAAEMANRLAETLAAWSVADEADLDDRLLKLTGTVADADIRARARRLFAETLETPGGLNLRTIHSFCESLIGRFPLESGVAPHFSVIDERTAAELAAEARNRVFEHARARGGEAVRDALAWIATHGDDARFEALMAEVARNRGRLARAIDGDGGLGAAVRAALGIEAGDDADALFAETRDGLDRAALGHARDVLAGGSKGDRERAATIGAWLDGSSSFEDYRTAFLVADGGPRKDLLTKAPREAHPEAEAALRAEQSRVADLWRRMRAVALAEGSESVAVAGWAVATAYDDIKVRRGVLDYDDLIGFARRLLADAGAVSWVHYKLDGGIDHVLVDEAQDTSPDQWAVIEALTGEFFAGTGAREDANRTVFVVGDEKQSIYSFQGADLEAFRAVHARFKARAEAAGRPWRDVGLERSFRSTWPVLDVVDDVFARPEAADGVVPREGHLRHLTERTADAGRVELWAPLQPADEPDDDPWDAPLDRSSAAAPDRRLAARIAETVRGWIEAAELLPSAGRPIGPGDVMILVQRRGPFYEHMVRALKQHGVAVAGADRMVLSEQMAVMDLMALGRFLLLPEDDLSLAEVLKSPLVGFDDAALFDLAHERGDGLWPTLVRRRNERADFAEAHARLAEWRGRVDLQPPYEFLARLLGADGGRRALLARLGPDAGDAIDEFLALALAYEREHVPSWQGFLGWAGAARTEVKRDLEQVRGAVRVMTVHGAKGLQAEIVILPDTLRIPGGGRDTGLFWAPTGSGEAAVPLWVPAAAMDVPETRAMRADRDDRRRGEYRRLLYVAMTRARDRLYVGGWRTKRAPADGNWHALIEPVMEATGTAIEAADGETAFRRDSPQARPPEPKPAAAPPEPSPLPDWALAPAPAEPEPPRPLAPSRPEDEPPARSPVGADAGARFARGRLIHRLLQGLPEIAPDRRADVARAWLARPVHGLDGAAQADVLAETIAVLDDPGLAPLFGPGSRAEVPLAGVVGGRVVSGQVDRLVVTPAEVVVADYKTHRAPPASADEVPAVYLRQMAAYRALLADVFPGRPVRCVLVWTDGPRAMALDDARLDGALP